MADDKPSSSIPSGRTTRGQVLNKAPAPVQISAEQILREAREREEVEGERPRQRITNAEELAEFKSRKRKEFEDRIRQQRFHIPNYMKYALWEAGQEEYDRARSVMERALDVDHRQISTWLKYAEMEMKGGFIGHAKNIWDRAVSILPRAEQFWYKYTHFLESIGDVPTARHIFERWMTFEPKEKAWLTFIKFEVRYDEIDRARALYKRFAKCYSIVSSFLRWAKFEEKARDFEATRAVFDKAVKKFTKPQYAGEVNNLVNLFLAYADFEKRQRETERVQAIFRYAKDHVPREHKQQVYDKFILFEKQTGSREGIDIATVGKRRMLYEDMLEKDSLDYDTWFDYIRLEESEGNVELVRQAYEKAVKCIPPREEKSFWRRYIYLWIGWAVFEELIAGDPARAEKVYQAALQQIPHKKFSFSKVWWMCADLHVRRKNIKAARAVLGQAMGVHPKQSLIRKYIKLEKRLGEIDRCRVLYARLLELFPSHVQGFVSFAKLESKLQEEARARAVFELGIKQPVLDMPELLWKSYIDFEVEFENADQARQLYERLLHVSKHVKVWISYAQFEAQQDEIEKARHVFERAEEYLATDKELTEERVYLLENFKEFEEAMGTKESLLKVSARMPQRVKKMRRLDDGSTEEYHDYLFPEDALAAGSPMGILSIAKKWAQAQSKA